MVSARTLFLELHQHVVQQGARPETKELRREPGIPEGLLHEHQVMERLLGRKTAENEVLKEAVTIAREKKLISESAWQSVKNLVEG